MLAARARVVSRALSTARGLSSTSPPPIDDSTSALDYKTSHKVRPPPLPKMDLPRSRSAEEAVTNILYNTPPPSLQPYKKHLLNCLVQNEPGVLSRVSGILAGRGFNIDSLVVCRTEIRDLSRMCIVISGQDGVVQQARRQLEDLVRFPSIVIPPSQPLHRCPVLDYTETRTISRELLLVKVSILGPEYLEDQLEGGPSHEPRAAHRAHAEQTKLEREMVLARHFEESTRPPPPQQPASEGEEGGKALTPSEALRRQHQHLHSLHTLVNQFGARLVDVSDHSVIVEMTGKTTRVEAFLALVKLFGIIESARTGLMAMPRTPIAGLAEDDTSSEVGSTVDASLLPPG
ncbi:acetolactate synthase [Lactarius deliciosus]|nr:acetolactate synthase [Lactarius deliciosus]